MLLNETELFLKYGKFFLIYYIENATTKNTVISVCLAFVVKIC